MTRYLITVREANLAEIHAARHGEPLPPPVDAEGAFFHRPEETTMLARSHKQARIYLDARSRGQLLVHDGKAWRVLRCVRQEGGET